MDSSLANAECDRVHKVENSEGVAQATPSLLMQVFVYAVARAFAAAARADLD
jgi:hypothetical protein